MGKTITSFTLWDCLSVVTGWGTSQPTAAPDNCAYIAQLRRSQENRPIHLRSAGKCENIQELGCFERDENIGPINDPRLLRRSSGD